MLIFFKCASKVYNFNEPTSLLGFIHRFIDCFIKMFCKQFEEINALKEYFAGRLISGIIGLHGPSPNVRLYIF